MVASALRRAPCTEGPTLKYGFKLMESSNQRWSSNELNRQQQVTIHLLYELLSPSMYLLYPLVRCTSVVCASKWEILIEGLRKLKSAVKVPDALGTPSIAAKIQVEQRRKKRRSQFAHHIHAHRTQKTRDYSFDFVWEIVNEWRVLSSAAMSVASKRYQKHSDQGKNCQLNSSPDISLQTKFIVFKCRHEDAIVLRHRRTEE